MNTEVRKTPGLGRGVFACRDFAPGEEIERCQLIVLPHESDQHIEKTLLDDYVFVWGRDQTAVVLGNGSLYNHSYGPNAQYVRDFDNEQMVFVALTAIPAGAEIRINYNGAPDCTDPLWFDCVE